MSSYLHPVKPQSRIEIKEINTQDLIVDNRYQRPLAYSALQRIIKNFDPNKLGVLYVSARVDGTFAIVDGQHRWEVCKIVAYSPLLCHVEYGLTPEEEAARFACYNRDRRQCTKQNIFKAELFKGDAIAVDISNIATSCGVLLGTSRPRPGTQTRVTAAYRALYDIYNWGPDILRETLQFCVDTWKLDSEALITDMVYGVGRFVLTYHNDIKLRLVSQKLANTSPVVLRRQASEANLSILASKRGSHQDGKYIAAAIVAVYNHSKKNDDSRLDGRKLELTPQELLASRS